MLISYAVESSAADDDDSSDSLALMSTTAGGTSSKQQRITELSDPSLTIAGKPFLTVYAQGVNNTDYPHPGGGTMKYVWQGAPYANATADDVAYVYDVLGAVAAAYTVDRARVYACGKSNGGGFAALLACRPDTAATFAAFAPVSPALYQEGFGFYGCAPARAVPLLHVHGVADTMTPFRGRTPAEGSFGPEPDVRVWRRQWAERNGCGYYGNLGKSSSSSSSRHDDYDYPGALAPPSSVREVHPGAWEEVWDCPGGAEVRALSVEGLGHSWPSTAGLDTAGSPNNTANFNLTHQHLVQFFSRHSLPVS